MFYVEANVQTLNSKKVDVEPSRAQFWDPSFLLPNFDLTDFYTFANDNFSLSSGPSGQEARNLLESKLHLVSTRLVNSGLKVNESQTELYPLYRKTPTQL